ncbi:unnamed protein product [Cylicocyclus nassatus]|uniref:BZIP domain-containing protein n=1 Tax=Cylicocyclus nassatus TaxID=53992 RepID=A0AA36MC02_CYLNA|nr:unnamed protein product [Cylicocyclus nassatus]
MTLHEPKVFSQSEEPHISQMDSRIPTDQAHMINGERPGVFHHEYDPSEELDTHTEMVAPNVDARIFERQDSLARAATLQECDRERDPEILNFLETTMNIEDYLEDITQATGVPSEEIDLDDYELQKCNILYQDDKMQPYDSYDPFAHDIGLHEHMVPLDYDPKPLTPAPTAPSSVENVVVKTEPAWESGAAPSTSNALPAKRGRGQPREDVYTPTTTARKYRLKTPQERNNTSYKVKRQRNNDAVRKSRTKAKQLQALKEKQFEEAQNELTRLRAKLQHYEKAQEELNHLRKELRMANERLAKCRCRR